MNDNVMQYIGLTMLSIINNYLNIYDVMNYVCVMRYDDDVLKYIGGIQCGDNVVQCVYDV
jgi:hypothetical protein